MSERNCCSPSSVNLSTISWLVSVESKRIGSKQEPRPGGRGDSHMEQTGMLVGNFEFNP